MEKDEIMQEVETPVEKPVETPAPKRNRAKIGEVNCDKLNLRAEPVSDADILYVMSKGDAVSILEEEKTFYKVLTKGVVGYCVKKYITVK